jgi:prophage regulatory protein
MSVFAFFDFGSASIQCPVQHSPCTEEPFRMKAVVHNPASAAADRLVSMREVCTMVGGVSRVSIYNWMEAGRFPKARRVGPRRMGWLESEVVAFLHQLEAA